MDKAQTQSMTKMVMMTMTSDDDDDKSLPTEIKCMWNVKKKKQK
jgi:hypothetical protein